MNYTSFEKFNGTIQKSKRFFLIRQKQENRKRKRKEYKINKGGEGKNVKVNERKVKSPKNKAWRKERELTKEQEEV